jgi:hypothetical protein
VPEPPRPPLEDEPRAQAPAASGDDGAAIPGPLGWQFSRGISA